jgi:pilus assembly protein Flp/PilA
VNKFLNFGKALWQDESGATAIEYGLLAALIAVVIIGTVVSLGKQLDATFKKVDTDLKANAVVTAPTTP